MVLAVSIVVGVLVGLALLMYAGFLAARYFHVSRYPDEIHFATTADNWRIALLRYRPQQAVGADPVLLVHGIAANSYNFDLRDDRSLAQYLSQAGYDVWVVELRGRGMSTRPRLFSKVGYDWCFDEYAERDLPSAAQTVLRATGGQRLHLLGFSTGALACYAFLTDPHRSVDVASLVSIGGPSTFKRTGKYVSGHLLRGLGWMRHRLLMRILAPLAGHWYPAPLQVIHNSENMSGAIERRAMVNLISNFARNELLQYGDWLVHDVFRSIDHRRDYRAELGRIQVPALFLAGPRDLLAPPDAVKDAHDAVGSAKKRFLICSRSQGFEANYGHLDMILGNLAPTEVYPVIRDWFDENAGVSRTVTSPPTKA